MIEKLRALLAAATPGPWELERGLQGCPMIVWRKSDAETFVSGCSVRPDAALIVAMRNELPRLLDQIEATQRVLRLLDERVKLLGAGNDAATNEYFLGRNIGEKDGTQKAADALRRTLAEGNDAKGARP